MKLNVISVGLKNKDGKPIMVIQENVLPERTISLSRNGGMKVSLTRGDKYVARKNFNDYSIHDISNRLVMVFDTEYNEELVIKKFAEYSVALCEKKIKDIDLSLQFWKSYCK